MVDTQKTIKFSKILVSSDRAIGPKFQKYDFSDENDGFPAPIFYMQLPDSLAMHRWNERFNPKKITYYIHSFIPAISIAPLQVLYYSEALPTTARILYRSFTPKRTGNCR